MQRQAPTPSHHCFLQAPTYRRLYPQFCKLQLARKLQLPSIFCRHQPTGGSNLSQLQLTFYQATTWCGSTNSHLFSAGTNLQEAPTSVSYNWHLSRYNLIGKLQLPYSFKRETLADLPWISALFCSICSAVHLFTYLPCIISASSRILYQLLFSSLPHFFIYAFSNLSMHIYEISFIEFISWLFVFYREFGGNSHNYSASSFSFLCPTHLEKKFISMYKFQYYSGIFVFLRILANASQTM